MINVEVIYALPHQQKIINIIVLDQSTVRSAIEASGVMDDHAELSWDTMEVGLFSRPTTLDAKLKDRDRVEIYRPLTIDPKEARRRRAAG